MMKNQLKKIKIESKKIGFSQFLKNFRRKFSSYVHTLETIRFFKIGLILRATRDRAKTQVAKNS